MFIQHRTALFGSSGLNTENNDLLVWDCFVWRACTGRSHYAHFSSLWGAVLIQSEAHTSTLSLDIYYGWLALCHAPPHIHLFQPVGNMCSIYGWARCIQTTIKALQNMWCIWKYVNLIPSSGVMWVHVGCHTGVLQKVNQNTAINSSSIQLTWYWVTKPRHLFSKILSKSFGWILRCSKASWKRVPQAFLGCAPGSPSKILPF